MNSVDSFSANFAEARTKFRKAVRAANGAVEAIEHPAQGPIGEPLFTDVAQFGARDAPKMLVLISGTHGVEGFCGSGAQVDFLRRRETERLPRDVGILMIHALNPFGFAWLRRVTHENIDLNRNWIDFAGPLPENTGYDQLKAFICPDEWSDASLALANSQLAEFGKREGNAALRYAISGGQYRHPQGIYYGGTTPSWSRTTQSDIFRHYLAQTSDVAVLDYHTGLGPWGYGERISTFSSLTSTFQRALRWYGAALTSTIDGTASAVRISGDAMVGAAALLPQATVTPIAIEFGTLSSEVVNRALRADAWLHAYGDPHSPAGKAIKRGVRNAFYGDSQDWKGMVAGQSLMVCRQALVGLISGQ